MPQVWGKFLCLFEQFERENKLITSPAIVKQKLLTLLCHDITQELRQGLWGATGDPTTLLANLSLLF